MPDENYPFRSSSKVDDKLRLKIPAVYQPLMEKHRNWFVTSLDGKTVRMYPAAVWQEELQRHGMEPEESLRFALENGLEEEMDSSGRMLLPPQARFSQPMRGQSVFLDWRGRFFVVAFEGESSV